MIKAVLVIVGVALATCPSQVVAQFFFLKPRTARRYPLTVAFFSFRQLVLVGWPFVLGMAISVGVPRLLFYQDPLLIVTVVLLHVAAFLWSGFNRWRPAGYRLPFLMGLLGGINTSLCWLLPVLTVVGVGIGKRFEWSLLGATTVGLLWIWQQAGTQDNILEIGVGIGLLCAIRLAGVSVDTLDRVFEARSRE